MSSIHEKVEQEDLFFPLSLGAKGSCMIGGNLSTNAGGINVLKYGNSRELCLGLEVVLPDGKIMNLLTELKKDNTGYDLKKLFIGAEGTLGIITGATLKLFPLPKKITTFFVEANTIFNALKLLNNKGEFISAKDGEMILDYSTKNDFKFSLIDNIGSCFTSI